MSEQYSPELHSRLRELSKNATPRPWYVEPIERMIVSGENDDTGEEVGAVYFHSGKGKKEKANRSLLTEAPNSIDALLDEIERLQNELETALPEAWEDGYADAICDIESVYEIDREAITHKTANHYINE